MCTSPILIKNRKFRPLNSLEYVHKFVRVPCGVCDECLRKRAKDIYVRARFASEDAFLAGGTGFMVTLTYDNDNVPVFEFNGKRMFVFNKKHVIDFIKRLRTSLDRFYNKHYGTDAPDFKYLFTSEFGTDPTRSHRPHYHGLILFRKTISLYSFF